MLWMAENDCAGEESAASGSGEGGLDIHIRGGGLQPSEDEKPAGQFSWCRMSKARSVSADGRSGQNGPQLEALNLLRHKSKAADLAFGKIRVADFAQKLRFSAAC